MATEKSKSESKLKRTPMVVGRGGKVTVKPGQTRAEAQAEADAAASKKSTERGE